MLCESELAAGSSFLPCPSSIQIDLIKLFLLVELLGGSPVRILFSLVGQLGDLFERSLHILVVQGAALVVSLGHA